RDRRGHVHPARVENSLTSFVVTHPRATFIIDPAVCTDVGQRAIAQLPAMLRIAVRPPADTLHTITALTRRPETPRLDFGLPTDAHWDHVSGLLDMPALPMHLRRKENEWIGSGPSRRWAVSAIRCVIGPSPITTWMVRRC